MKNCLLLAWLFTGTPGYCQQTLPSSAGPAKVVDLAEFVVRSTKLTPLDILDSIIFYEPKNYSYPAGFAASISGTLFKGNDTLFQAVSGDVYFCRNSKKKPTYRTMVLKEGRPEVLINKLDSLTKRRISWSTGYPPTVNFREWLFSLQRIIQKNRVLFGTSMENNTLLHHILIQYYPQSGNQENKRFIQFVIERKDWKLIRTEYYIFDSDNSFLNGADSVQSCHELLQLLEAAVRQPNAVYHKWSEEFRPCPTGQLVPYEYDMQDNLLFSTGDYRHTVSDTNSPCYRYNVLFTGILESLPAESTMTTFVPQAWLMFQTQ